MFQKSADPPIVHLSTWVYSLLLVFYPIPFQREYGPHMAQVFRDCCLKVHHQSGTLGMLSLWAITLFDWLKTVLEEQTQKGTAMTREKFIRMSGWGMILSGVSLLLGFLASNIDTVLGRSLMSHEVNRYETISMVLIFAGSLLLVLGFTGLLLRYGGQSGQIGKIMLLGGILFGLLSIAGAGVLGAYDAEWSWMAWFISFTMIFVCLSLFGLLNLRKKLLPRWNALPLVAGIGIPLFVLLSYIWEIYIGGWVDDQGVSMLIILVTAVSVGLLGFVLQGDVPLEGKSA